MKRYLRIFRKIPLHWKILAGIVLGVAFGLIMSLFPFGSGFVSDWIKPFGNIFINALKLIAIPLIIASLIKGITDLKDITSLSKMGVKTFLLYIFTTVVAICIGLIMVNIIQPGHSISEKTRIDLVDNFKSEADQKILQAENERNSGPLSSLESLIPENIFEAADDNSNMLQIIVVVIFFGIGLILIPEKKAMPVKAFFDGLNDVILKLIDILMLSAPYGVFALMASLVVESPNVDLFVALGLYSLTVIIGLLLILVFYSLLIKIFTEKSPGFFYKGIAPAQLLAFSTSSSIATLPLTMERVEEKLGVDKEVSSFVLPIGATINMDGTSLYQAIAAVFIAQALGMDLSIMTQLGIIVTATLASIGSAAVPGAGMVMLVIVLAQAGIPEAGLVLIFAVDRPLDMCRTAINISGDACISMMIAKNMGKLNTPVEKTI